MKKRMLCTLLALAAAGTPALAHNDAHDHQARHGGVVVEAGDLDFELVATPTRITLHVRDHGQPARLQGASARLTLLSGSARSELTLLAVDDKRLQAEGSYALEADSKALALVTLAGRKPISVRFVLKRPT